jgi:hypothetical protein
MASAAALTAAATLQCPHGGVASIVPSSPRATAGGSPLVTIADTFIIAGCTFTLPGPVPSPCVRVQWVVPATRANAAKVQALHANSVGLCLAATGLPQGPVSIQPAQTQVKAT